MLYILCERAVARGFLFASDSAGWLSDWLGEKSEELLVIARLLTTAP